MAVGERLRLPVVLVEVPGHNFVRWSSPDLRMNWDTNQGLVKTDSEYAVAYGVTDLGRKHLNWLSDLSVENINGYWLSMIAGWHERHGRYSKALEAYRAAIQADRRNLASTNNLAGFLATCPDAAFRDGPEATKIALRTVAAAPRANWLDTLAAARAESGDFAFAVETESRAKAAARTAEWGDPDDDLADFDACIAVYRQELSYRQGVELGRIKPSRPELAYDE